MNSLIPQTQNSGTGTHVRSILWTVVFLGTLFGSLSHAGNDSLQGTWFAAADRHHDDPDRISLQLRNDDRLHRGDSGMLLRIGELTGVTREQIDAGTDVLVFSMVREPGTTTFEGRFHKGTGSGTYRFVLNEAFETALRQRGFRNIRLREFQAMAFHDVTLAWIDELAALGFEDIDVDDLLAMSIHGADVDFIREMQEIGFDGRDVDEWVAMRIHGVDARYVRSMRAQGLDTNDPDAYIGLRIHQVTPEFLAEMHELGYDLDLEEGQAFRIHGVDAAFIGAMTELLQARLDADDLLAMRIHGVDARFIEELHEMGYDDLTADELVELRIHGVDRQTLRKWSRHRKH
jgi:hypothetical protein